MSERSVSPTLIKQIPYGRHWVGPEEQEEVRDTLEQGYLTSGPKVELFENRVREYLGASHTVAVSSCSAALHLALLALGIGPGDEVITTVFTYVATANAILHTGAAPVFTDIDPATYNVDASQIEKKITSRTKALLVVHYAGQPCRMSEIRQIAERRRLFVVEDASHAIGASYRGEKIGAASDAACFSFHPVKNMTTAEGGLVATRLEKVANLIRILRLHGISEDYRARETKTRFEYPQMVHLGFKYNMTDLQASLGLQQLKKLESFEKRRAGIAGFYADSLADLKEVELPQVSPDVEHAWHLFVIRLKLDRLAIDRGQVMKELEVRGISTSVHYLPIHLQPYYKGRFGFKEGDFPLSEKAYESVLTLPLFPKMSDEDARRVVQALREVVFKHRK